MLRVQSGPGSFEETAMFFLRPQLLWYFACLLDVLNPSDQIQEALPTAAEVIQEAWDMGLPVTGRARFQQSVGGKQGL